MSTKTNFKRIALVAVAALGLGVLSSVPSQAGVTGAIVVTNTNGTATTALADSTTGGTLAVRWLSSGATDSVVISTSLNTKPAASTFSGSLRFVSVDTTTSVATAGLFPALGGAIQIGATSDTAAVQQVAGSNMYVAGKFKYNLSAVTTAGTYTFTLTITPFAATGVESTKVVTQDVSIVVTAPASASTTAATTYSTAKIMTATGSASTDSATAESASVSALATISATNAARASVFVQLLNAVNAATYTVDSLTVTIDKGNVGSANNAPLGKSVIMNYVPSGTDGGVKVYIFSDGTSGPATITIATKNAGTFTKTLNFYGADYKTITAASYRSVIGVGAEATLGAVSATAADANGTSYGAAIDVYAYSSDTSVISNFGTACTYNSVTKAAMCGLTGVKAGTATITVRDADTVALSTVASTAVSVRVSQGVATSFTLKTDKATYVPGEKGYLWVTVLDAAGLAMPVLSDATVLASGGITSTVQTGTGSDTTTATVFSTERSATPASNDPVKVYTFYAPVNGGPIVFSAKGAAAYSAASQATATTVTATVTDNAAAALAAVTALATTVASLKTLITTLTNLVLKIQKKVKA